MGRLINKIFFLVVSASCASVVVAGGNVSSLLNQTTQSLSASAASAGIGFIILAFLAGILTSLLPCIYPMIPITVGIIQGQKAQSVRRNFQLTFAYVNGLALVYAMLGYISAKSAVLFGSWLGKPWFIVIMTLLFLYLAGSMIGLYEVYIPRALQSPATVVAGGSVPHCFLLGMLASLVASPCLAPPLVVLMGLVAKQANPFIGFIALYAFSLGMCMILLAVGTFSGALSLLPRAGTWLDTVKQVMGFVLLGVAIHFLQPLVGIKTLQGLYACVLLSALWFFCYRIYVHQTHQGHVWGGRFAIAVALLLTALCGIFFKPFFFWIVGILA